MFSSSETRFGIRRTQSRTQDSAWRLPAKHRFRSTRCALLRECSVRHLALTKAAPVPPGRPSVLHGHRRPFAIVLPKGGARFWKIGIRKCRPHLSRLAQASRHVSDEPHWLQIDLIASEKRYFEYRRQWKVALMPSESTRFNSSVYERSVGWEGVRRDRLGGRSSRRGNIASTQAADAVRFPFQYCNLTIFDHFPDAVSDGDDLDGSARGLIGPPLQSDMYRS